MKEEAGRKKVKSGSALFMYIVIAAMLAIGGVMLGLYYGGVTRSGAVLWIGIAAVTIVYHFWGRLLLGSLTRHFSIRHGQWWFRERSFEKKLYKLLRVRRWKEKVLTYDPAAYDVKKHTLRELADTMSKSETDHWVNELLSLSTLLFAFLWGKLWIFALTALLAMLFDAQFIVVQRYNRPHVLRLMARREARGLPETLS